MPRERLGNKLPGDRERIGHVGVKIDRGHVRVPDGESVGQPGDSCASSQVVSNGTGRPVAPFSLPSFHATPAISRCAQSYFLGELRQEARRGDAAARSPGDVGEIGEVAGESLVVIVPERHLPAAVERFLAGVEQCACEAIAVAEHATRDVTQGDNHGAGQRGDVDDRCRFVALGIGERIAQNQASFGIGVQDFDGLPRHALDDIARLGGSPVRHVLAGRDQTDDVDLGFELPDRAKCAQDARRAAHVEFHLVHVETGLERNPAAIEGNSLADQDEGFLLLPRAPILEHNELRRLIAAVGHRKE